jgi:hypothetical protein
VFFFDLSLLLLSSPWVSIASLLLADVPDFFPPPVEVEGVEEAFGLEVPVAEADKEVEEDGLALFGSVLSCLHCS